MTYINYSALGLIMFLGFGFLHVSAPEHTTYSSSRVVMENDHVRVTEWLASEKVLVQVQEISPGVLISFNRMRLKKIADSGQATIVDYRPGEAVWIEEFKNHRWKSLIGVASFFIIEIKSAADEGAPETKKLDERDSVLIDPIHHKLIFENAHVRVIDGMASVGAISPSHSHPPSVLISLTKSRFRVKSRGITSIFDFEPYQVTWVNSFEHEWEVMSGDARVVVVEVKSAHVTGVD